LSFRLSFVSALALTLVLQGVGGAGVTGFLKTGFLATAAAQVATTPVLISTFGRVSPLSLPTNVVIASLVAVAFPIAFVASLVGFVSSAVGEAVSAPGALSADAIVRAVEAMSALPGAQLTVATLGTIGNAMVAAASIAAIALLSPESRRALRRTWGSVRIARSPVLAMAGIGCVGFLIGLALGATR
jgi:hypothetical protein